MLCVFSPFEESAIFSYWWLLSQWCNIDLLTLSKFMTLSTLDSYYSEAIFEASFMFFDAVDFVYSSFFFFIDSNYTLVLFIICTFFSFFCFKRSVRRNNKLSSKMFNSISDFVYSNMVLSYLGLDGRRYFSFFLFLFYFILFGNLLGLVPSFFPLTSNLSVTLFLSSISWLSIFLVGLYFHGIKFFSSFFPSKVPFILAPFLMSVEFISYLVRLASLSLRLFANIVAGHILLDTISLFYYYLNITVNVSFNYATTLCGLVLLFLLFVMIFFELLIALLQAYIFVVLVIIYLNDSIHLHV